MRLHHMAWIAPLAILLNIAFWLAVIGGGAWVVLNIWKSVMG